MSSMARMKSNYYTPIKAKPKKEHYYNFGGHTARREQAEGRGTRHSSTEHPVQDNIRGLMAQNYSGLELGIADLSEINKPLNETEKKEEDLTLCSNVLWE